MWQVKELLKFTGKFLVHMILAEFLLKHTKRS
jgi:hypothetical protein